MASRCCALSRVELLSLAVLLAVGLAGGAAWSWQHVELQAAAEPSVAEPLTQPSPDFGPGDVVALQLAALGEFRDDPQAVGQCYAFASPANRVVTGPMTRFARMVLGGDYRPLVFHDQVLVGTPNVKGDRAAVLASVIDAERNLSIYCFYLSRQTDAPHRGCWMTDSVIRVPPMDEPPTRSEAEREPESV
jgi:hypothetical protein